MSPSRAFATIATVWRKEVRESLRDRRTLMSALLFGPLFGPLILAVSLQFLVHRSAEEADQRPRSPCATPNARRISSPGSNRATSP